MAPIKSTNRGISHFSSDANQGITTKLVEKANLNQSIGLPTPPQDGHEGDEMNRPLMPGNVSLRAVTAGSAAPIRTGFGNGYDEIVFSSDSSSSDDDADRVRPSRDISKGKSRQATQQVKQPERPVAASSPQAPAPMPALSVPGSSSTFRFPQPQRISLKRTSDGRTKEWSATSNTPISHSIREAHTPSATGHRASPSDVGTPNEDDSPDAAKLLRRFVGANDGKDRDKSKRRGADETIPIALQRTDSSGPSLGTFKTVNSSRASSQFYPDHSQLSPPPASSGHSSRSSSHPDRSTPSHNDSIRVPDAPRSSSYPHKWRAGGQSTHLKKRAADKSLDTHQPSRRSQAPQIHPLKSRRYFPAKGHHAKTRNRPRKPFTSDHHLLRAPISTLLQREIGNRHRSRMAFDALQSRVQADLHTTHQWKGASGDIMVVDWHPDGLHYVAGAMAAADVRNPQYNRRNNLLIGDLKTSILREVPDHYLGRRSTNGYSAEHPAPLFTTITDVKFDLSGAHMFSSSYDWTVKMLDVTESTPQCIDTFWHDNPVEVMALSPVETNGLLATATNHSVVATDKPVSLFNVYDEDARKRHMPIYPTCSGGLEGYTPTVMNWGAVPAVENYLVAGFSKKQTDGREEPAHHGLLCLWEVSNSAVTQKNLMPSTQNVFDAVWHPADVYLATANPVIPAYAVKYGHDTRSLIRIYNPRLGIHKVMEYECPGVDVNIVSFSATDQNIISASCTNGVTYVWDPRNPGKALHELRHGDYIYPTGPVRDRELHDTGVRLALWGPRGDYFYSGSSDGVLKQWDIKLAPDNALVRDVKVFPAEIMSGKFSPDFAHLLVGDAAGGISILSADPHAESDAPEEISFERAILPEEEGIVNQTSEAIEIDAADRPAAAAAQELIRSGRIVVDPIFGPGKGPAYDGPYAPYAHVDGDPLRGLVPEIRAMQFDEHQSCGFENMLDEESIRRKHALQGLARVRNRGVPEGSDMLGVNMEPTKETSVPMPVEIQSIPSNSDTETTGHKDLVGDSMIKKEQGTGAFTEIMSNKHDVIDLTLED